MNIGAREAQRKEIVSDNKWMIEWYTEDKTSKGKNAVIGEGTNRYGDGPERIIGTIERYEDAELICELHNNSLGIK